MSTDQKKQITKLGYNILNHSLIARNKAKFSIQQFLNILKKYQTLRQEHRMHPITSINDRGIFITLLVQMLYKGYLSYQLKLKGIAMQFQFKQRKKRNRTARNDDESDDEAAGVRKKRVNKNQRQRGRAMHNIGNDIEDLSNDSLTNPSNVERPRIMNTENKDDSSNPTNSNRQKPDENSQGSKNSGQNNDKLKLELNKITEQIRGHQDTYVTGIEDFEGIHIEQNSQSQSQSQSNSNSSPFRSQQISDLNQKLRILTETKDVRHLSTRKKTGNKRNTNRSAFATTKKKMMNLFSQVLDEKLEEPTGYEMTEMTLNNIGNISNVSELRVSMFDGQQSTILQKQKLLKEHEAQKQFDQFQEEYMGELLFNDMRALAQNRLNKQPAFDQLFSTDSLDKLRYFLQRNNVQEADTKFEQPNMMRSSQDDYIGIEYPDYTMSQPITGPVDYPSHQQPIEEEDEQLKQSLKDILSKKKRVDLTSLSNQTRNDQSLLFYKLLWKFQQGQVNLTQDRVEQFDPIYVQQN